MKNLEFENRTYGENPNIKRIEYNGFYIYLLKHITGYCTCCYNGIDEDYKINWFIKARKVAKNYSDCELVLTKNGKSKVKLPKKTANKILALFNDANVNNWRLLKEDCEKL